MSKRVERSCKTTLGRASGPIAAGLILVTAPVQGQEIDIGKIVGQGPLSMLPSITLHVGQPAPDYIEWKQEFNEYEPVTVKFRATTESADLGAARWQVLADANDPSSVIAEGAAGVFPTSKELFFDIDFRPIVGTEQQRPLYYWVRVLGYKKVRYGNRPPLAGQSYLVRVGVVAQGPPTVFEYIDIPPGGADYLNLCSVLPHTYYRLPFGPGPHWKLSQGIWNDPVHGHGGVPWHLQAQAFDFKYDADDDGIGEEGQPIRAARGGIVYAASDTASGNSWGTGNPPGYNGVGNFLVIEHENKTYGIYWHMQPGSITVNLGDTVQRGDVIAQVGNTGNSSDPHVHFQVSTDWSLGYPMDEIEYPSMQIRFQDANHPSGCWLPRVGEPMSSNNGP